MKGKPKGARRRLAAPRPGGGGDRARSSGRALVQWSALLTAILVGVATPGVGLAIPRLVQTPVATVESSHHGPVGMAALPAPAETPQLAAAEQPPTPAPPSISFGEPMKPHELFGFAPYWTLGNSGGFDVGALTTIAYFGVDVNADGSLARGGAGWDGYQSQALAGLISRAHAAGGRVVLTAKDFDGASLHQLSANPQAAANRLGAELAGAIRDKNMDGANLDFEGLNGGDREGFAQFATGVARALHAANPHWQVTIDTYTSSAAGGGFFDIAALAPAMDAFFVMAYDMYGDGVASPNSPLAGSRWNATAAMATYSAVVNPAKVLLGVPFYGYDWITADNRPGSQALSPPNPISYAEIAAAHHDMQWDFNTSVPWTAYRDGSGAWHETYYDNPVSLSMKAQLVNRQGLRGLGIWALGMDGNDPAMTAALLGNAAPLKLGPAPAWTPLPSAGPTPAAAGGSKPGASPSPAGTPSPTPSGSPTPGESPSPTGSPSPTPSSSPTPSGSPSPTDSPSPPPAPASTPSPPPEPTPAPTASGLAPGTVIQVEGESMLPVVAATAPVSTQAGGQWSGGAQLLLAAAGVGDYATVAFDVPNGGVYDLSLPRSVGPSSGAYLVKVDGGQVGLTCDAYAPTAGVTAPQELGQLHLAAGRHTLTVVVTGKNAAATGYSVGLDYIDLRFAG